MSTIKTIKERMTALKNKCISRMSKVGEIQPSDQEAVEKVKNCATPSSYYNFLGKTEQKVEKEASVRKIKNRNDDYFVADGTTSLRRQIFFGDPRIIDPALVDTTFRHIAVMYQDKIVSVSIAANNTIEEGERKVPDRCISLDDSYNRVELDAGTDIYDTNAVRYQIKDNKELANFFDKFVIVTPEERKAYQDYEARQEREAALQAKRQERENREARKAARKKAEQDAARAAAAKKEALNEQRRQKKLRERFVGKE